MELLRNECKLDLCFTPLYMLEKTNLKICYLNARSLHKHIDDVRKDTNYLSVNILIFTETRFSPHDPDEMYAVDGYELFRNDETSNVNRSYHGTAVYSRLRMLNGYPYARNLHGIELTNRKNNRTSRLNYNWNIQISKGCIIFSFNCHSYYIGGKSFFTCYIYGRF